MYTSFTQCLSVVFEDLPFAVFWEIITYYEDIVNHVDLLKISLKEKNLIPNLELSFCELENH
jgi:hypothetical protein